MPKDKWEFDEQVAGCFDDMLKRSIPGYGQMRQACFSVGRRFVQPKTAIIDLGCARGGALAQFVDTFGPRNAYVGLDVSEPMLVAARERFKPLAESGVAVDIYKCDLRKSYPVESASVTLSIFTLQFTPIEHRQHILHRIFEHTSSGGCLILAEKVMGSDAAADTMLTELYLDMKREHGYSQDEINRKRLALEGELVPLTAAGNEELLLREGFQHVECFWRHFNFAAWVGVKP